MTGGPYRVRAATTGDRPACVALFDGHVGGAFRPEERPDFLAFLDHPPGPLHVVTDSDDSVVAAGGVASEADPSLVSLCWGIVDARRQREGLGTALLLARALVGAERLGARSLRLSTTPETTGFFAGLGFHTERVDPDGHGPGSDAVEMRLDLTPAWLEAARTTLVRRGVSTDL